jgi:hypothetical protein
MSPGNLVTLFNKTDQEASITKCKRVSNPKVYKSEHVGQVIGGSVEPIINRREIK